MKFKVGDRVRVLSSQLTTGSMCELKEGIIYKIIGNKYYLKDCFNGFKHDACAHLATTLELEDKMSKYDELKGRIEAVEGWTKEADDICSAIYPKLENHFVFQVDIGSNGRIQAYDNNYSYTKSFGFNGQCEKNRAFKKALLWLLDHSNIPKKSETEQKIDDLQEQIDKLRKEL